jgi:N-acetylglucosaminyldiphosphoundecaprenol N-acetyl-beta-D-mannosaminyltransferase
MAAFGITILPRAKLGDVVRRRALLIGSRFDTAKPRGFLSPIEARLRMGIPYGNIREAEEDYLSHRSVRTDLGILARTALAYVLSPSRRAEAVRTPFIVSAPVSNLTIDEAVDAICAPPLATRARLMFFVHAHALNLARFRPAYAELLANADTLLPDGIGIRLAANFLGVSLRHNLNGTDLFPLLCREAVARGIPLALIGGAPGIAEQCARRMRAEITGLDVPLVSDGYFANADAARDVANRVRALGRCLVLVGMGSPRQEEWATKFLSDCAGATVLTVGGLFDFYSGRMPRAPIFWRETGLEWMYRLLQEPRRLAKRYLLGNPLFLALALEQKLRGPITARVTRKFRR